MVQTNEMLSTGNVLYAISHIFLFLKSCYFAMRTPIFTKHTSIKRKNITRFSDTTFVLFIENMKGM